MGLDRWFVEETPSPTKGPGFTAVVGPVPLAEAQRLAFEWASQRTSSVVHVWQHPHDIPAPFIGACEDCGLPYGQFPLDTVLPDTDWLKIHPTGGGGLLCAGCIVERAARLVNTIVVYARLVPDTDHATFRQIKNLTWAELARLLNFDARAIVEALDTAGARVEPYCECGSPYSQHRYWEDKIYDVNGRRCPNHPWNRDYRYDATLTEDKRVEAKAQCLAALLATRPPSPS